MLVVAGVYLVLISVAWFFVVMVKSIGPGRCVHLTGVPFDGRGDHLFLPPVLTLSWHNLTPVHLLACSYGKPMMTLSWGGVFPMS